MSGNEIKFSICKRCGRPLKSERSQLRGYGPGCLKKKSEIESVTFPLFEGTKQNLTNVLGG
jgi:RNA polymerase-binding transcription factor DksA